MMHPSTPLTLLPLLIFKSLSVESNMLVSPIDRRSATNGMNESEGPNMCSIGTEQSPVNIIEKDCLPAAYPPLTFLDDVLFSNDVLFENNRETVKITLANKTSHVRVKGGVLDGNIDYFVDNVHFHWASREVFGCEHTIDGERFPMEAHIVLYKSTAKDFATARANKQIAAVSYIFETIENFTNNALRGVIDSVGKVKHPQSVKVSGSVLSFLKDYIGGGFYTYTGSLTTEPCTEGVLWMILKNRVFIGDSQLAIFHDVVGDDEVELHNWRNTRPLNGRIVWQTYH